VSIEIRPAQTKDIPAIRGLIDTYTLGGRLLAKETVTLYEDVQEFSVAVEDDVVVGCGALHVLWEDLAEVRTVAVLARLKGQGVGHKILETIIERARVVGVQRIFCLTFETQFFGPMVFKKFMELQSILMSTLSFYVLMTQASPSSSILSRSSPIPSAIPGCSRFSSLFAPCLRLNRAPWWEYRPQIWGSNSVAIFTSRRRRAKL